MIMGRENALRTLSKIIKNPRCCVIIYFTTESTKASCFQRMDGIRLTLNSALFICLPLLLLFSVIKAIRRWAVLGSNIPAWVWVCWLKMLLPILWISSGFWFLNTGFLLGVEGEYYVSLSVRYTWLFNSFVTLGTFLNLSVSPVVKQRNWRLFGRCC